MFGTYVAENSRLRTLREVLYDSSVDISETVAHVLQLIAPNLEMGIEGSTQVVLLKMRGSRLGKVFSGSWIWGSKESTRLEIQYPESRAEETFLWSLPS